MGVNRRSHRESRLASASSIDNGDAVIKKLVQDGHVNVSRRCATTTKQLVK